MVDSLLWPIVMLVVYPDRLGLIKNAVFESKEGWRYESTNSGSVKYDYFNSLSA